MTMLKFEIERFGLEKHFLSVALMNVNDVRESYRIGWGIQGARVPSCFTVFGSV